MRLRSVDSGVEATLAKRGPGSEPAGGLVCAQFYRLLIAILLTVTAAAAQITVTTAPATGVGGYGATLNGTVDTHGAAAQFWFEWRKDAVSWGYSLTSSQPVPGGSGAQAVSVPLPGLQPHTRYEFRVAAQSGEVVVKADPLRFTTGDATGAPVVITAPPTLVRYAAATLNGGVNPNWLATDFWFEWGTESTLASYASTAPNPLAPGPTALPVSAEIQSGLTPGKTYYYRVVASSSAGTSRGEIVSFRTTFQPPDEPRRIQHERRKSAIW